MYGLFVQLIFIFRRIKMTLGEDSENNRYIFTDSDFEDDTFHAALFVARYRRVAPLESLKDQLKSYSLNIKNQLYEIINRDYKNFIKIATKVSGNWKA